MREKYLLSLKELGRIEFFHKAIDKFTDNKSTIREALNSIKVLNVDYINPNEEEIYIIRNAFKHLEILDFLIKSGLNVKDEKFDLIISICNTTKAKPEVLNRLIERGANLDVKDKDGNTPLHLACRSGNIKLAKVLIENKVNLTSENKEGHTPLYLAAQNADLSCAKFLIERLLEADSNREMSPLLNEDRELLEHWNSCKNHTREKATNAVRESTTTTQNMQRSKVPTIAVTLAMITIPAALVAHFVFQASLLTTGIIAGIGACCLVAAAIIYYCNKPSNSLENSNTEVAMNHKGRNCNAG